jgi:uncharacterized protein (TIGR02598 family)
MTLNRKSHATWDGPSISAGSPYSTSVLGLIRCGVSGFSLVEVAVSMGIVAFCLVMLLGLLPGGINSNQSSFDQTAVASVAREIVTDLRATQQSAASPYYQIPFPATGTSYTFFLREDGSPASSTGSPALNVDADATQKPSYRATVSFHPPAAGQRAASTASVLITWPALANPKADTSPTRCDGYYEVVVAFDCN